MESKGSVNSIDSGTYSIDPVTQPVNLPDGALTNILASQKRMSLPNKAQPPTIRNASNPQNQSNSNCFDIQCAPVETEMHSEMYGEFHLKDKIKLDEGVGDSQPSNIEQRYYSTMPLQGNTLSFVKKFTEVRDPVIEKFRPHPIITQAIKRTYSP